MHVQMCILIVIYFSGKRQGINGAWASVFKCLPKVLTHIHRSPENKASPLGPRPNILGKYPILTAFESLKQLLVTDFFPHFFLYKCKITSC